ADINSPISELLRSLAAAPVDNQFAITNFDRSAAVGGAEFAEIISQRAGAIFPIEHVGGHRLVIDGDAAEARILQRLRAVAFDHDVAIQIIAPAPNVFAQRHASLNTQTIAFDRDEYFATSMPIVRDQII